MTDVGDDSFAVSRGRHLTTSLVHHARPLWRGLGKLESSMLRSRIEQTAIEKPIYISGLARSGTSVLIEIVASHPDVATHQYRDFPFLFTPYWWRQALDRGAVPAEQARERAHGDRLMVTSQSPEAMEEVLWMAYFRDLHDARRCHALDATTSNPAFERFYRDHIRKLLLIAGRTRYATKGNYNLTRMAYLQQLFPDARFVLPVRRPREHIASLMKQHQIFTAAAKRHPRSVAHLDRVGHFEFGVHRHCINPDGRAEIVESIEDLWRSGHDVRGWARYWANLYRWVNALLESNQALRRATLIVRYEDLCDHSERTLQRLLQHCCLPDPSDELPKRWALTLRRPTYYQPEFSHAEESAIAKETDGVAAALGYT